MSNSSNCRRVVVREVQVVFLGRLRSLRGSFDEEQGHVEDLLNQRLSKESAGRGAKLSVSVGGDWPEGRLTAAHGKVGSVSWRCAGEALSDVIATPLLGEDEYWDAALDVLAWGARDLRWSLDLVESHWQELRGLGFEGEMPIAQAGASRPADGLKLDEAPVLEVSRDGLFVRVRGGDRLQVSSVYRRARAAVAGLRWERVSGVDRVRDTLTGKFLGPC